MNLYQTDENRFRRLFRGVVAVWLFLFAMTSAIMLFVIPGNSAHSSYRYDQTVSSSNVRAPVQSDPCLSLIDSRKSASPAQANGVYASNKMLSVLSNGAGSSFNTNSELGLMIGIHYMLAHQNKSRAFTPKVEKYTLKDSVNSDRTPSLTTQSISAYRQCKKEVALQALNTKK